MMDLKNYQDFCETFFKQKMFESNEALATEIKQLSVEEFKAWQDKIFLAYDEKYNVIRNIIAAIRLRENFDVDSSTVDWDTDPIKQGEDRILVKSYQEIHNVTFEKHIAQYPIYEQKYNELVAHMQNVRHQEEIKISVDGKDFIAKQIIDVYWSGWECDSAAWLVEDEGVNKLVTTDHGTPSFTDKSFLEGKIKEYQQAIEDTKAMLNQLN